VPTAFLRTAKRRWFRFRDGRLHRTGADIRCGTDGIVMLAKRFPPRLSRRAAVGVLLPASVGAALVNMGLMLAGKTPVNLNFTIGAEAMDGAIGQSGIKTISRPRCSWQKRSWSRVPARSSSRRWMSGLGKAERPDPPMQRRCSCRRLCWPRRAPKGDPFPILPPSMFSSGSTGEPKGVMLSHKQRRLQPWKAIAQILGAVDEDRVMGVLPFFHAFGFTGTLACRWCWDGRRLSPNPLDANRSAG